MTINTAKKYVRIFVYSQQCVFGLHMDDMADMIFQLYHLYLAKYFIQEKHDLN